MRPPHADESLTPKFAKLSVKATRLAAADAVLGGTPLEDDGRLKQKGHERRNRNTTLGCPGGVLYPSLSLYT